jgi:uncharacterized protein (TIGR00369 family)
MGSMMNENAIALPRYNECFVCGKDNPSGFDITFYYRNGRIEANFVPQERHTGYKNVVHGGLLATLLDECMGWSSILSRKVMCVAAELSVRYKVSAHVGDNLTVHGELVADRKRIINVQGEIVRDDGTVICSGEGKFVPLAEADQQQVVEYAGWGKRLDEVHQEIMRIKS